MLYECCECYLPADGRTPGRWLRSAGVETRGGIGSPETVSAADAELRESFAVALGSWSGLSVFGVVNGRRAAAALCERRAAAVAGRSADGVPVLRTLRACDYGAPMLAETWAALDDCESFNLPDDDKIIMTIGYRRKRR